MPEDYILRLFRQVGAMLATIMGHRQAGNVAAAEERIASACQQTSGLPLEMIRHSSPEMLTAFLTREDGLRFVDAVMLGELLLQDAELCEADGRMAEALRSREQAFCLLADSLPSLPREEELHYREKLESLAPALLAVSKDAYTLEKLRPFVAGAAV